MKKLFSKCLTAVLAVSLMLTLGMFASAAGSATMEVRFEKDKYSAGDIVTAQVYVKSVEYNAVGFSLKYNTDIMKPVTAEGTDSDKVLQLVRVNELYDGINETGYYQTNACAADLSAGTLKVNLFVQPGAGTIGDNNGAVAAGDEGRLLATISFKMLEDGKPELEFATLAGDPDFANKTCYALLNGKGPEFITEVVYLEESISNDELAARAVEAKIDAIAASSDKAAAVAAARSAYDALTETQKALVDNYDVLTAAEAALASELADAKADAKAALDSYKNPDDYRDAQKEELAAAIEAGKAAIDGADSVSGVEKALADAKMAIDAIQTDAELTAVEKVREDAKKELESYKNADDYRDAQKEELAAAIEAGKAAIDGADSVSGVEKALADAKTAIDAIQTDAELTAVEEAKENAKKELESYKNEKDYRDAQKKELASAIKDGKGAIDNAKTISEVEKALSEAKTKIDAIKTDAQLTSEENGSKGDGKVPQTGDDMAVMVAVLIVMVLSGAVGVAVTKFRKNSD